MNNRRSFITGIKSTKLSIKEKKFLKKYKPWGVILFDRNIINIEQAFKLTSSIKKIFNDKKYPILIDQEGGRVNRLKNIISFDNLSSEFFGNKYVNNYKEFKFFYKLFVDKTSYLLKLILLLYIHTRYDALCNNYLNELRLFQQTYDARCCWSRDIVTMSRLLPPFHSSRSHWSNPRLPRPRPALVQAQRAQETAP